MLHAVKKVVFTLAAVRAAHESTGKEEHEEEYAYKQPDERHGAARKE